MLKSLFNRLSKQSLTTFIPPKPMKINLPVSDGTGPTPTLSYKPSSVRTGLLALKKGMTSIWDEYGTFTPVTVLQLEQVQVLKSYYNPQSKHYKVQVCAVDAKRSSRVLRNQFLKYRIKPKRYIREFRVSEDSCLPSGLPLKASHFVPGQFIDVRSKSVGKGFQGVMKRHGFKGGRATHGNSLSHRSLGSTGGCQDPGKVWKGKKMPGQMGNKYVTVQSLKVVKVDCKYGLVYVKGAVPGKLWG
jgi:large subunit ribosomal protein L3